MAKRALKAVLAYSLGSGSVAQAQQRVLNVLLGLGGELREGAKEGRLKSYFHRWLQALFHIFVDAMVLILQVGPHLQVSQ
jgi:hypothetical protein